METNLKTDKTKAHHLLVIGAGGVGAAYIKKLNTMPALFASVHLASRTIQKCKDLKAACPSLDINVYEVDADYSDQVYDLILKTGATLVVNLALPYQDLAIMDACLKAKVPYIDTANYEPKDEAKFCYKWQWDYHQRFKDAGILALLGSGFDPGVTNVYCKYADTHYFDEIETIDILDCNGGDHGQSFATNFNPEINIREITQKGKYFHEGVWHETPALSVHRDFDFPGIGSRRAYLMYHEELESLAKHIPGVKRLRFWMTFSESYLTHLHVLQNVGLTSISPVDYKGQSIIPLEFLKACLPDPASLAQTYSGKTCIGCLIKGKKDGHSKTIFIYNNCDHAACYKEIGSQAVSYTTAIPALLGTLLVADGTWSGQGVFNIEEFDPDPFMNHISDFGLPWSVQDLNETEAAT